MVLTIWENIEKFLVDVKQFFIDHTHDPVLWIGIIIVGLIIFEIVFQALHKE